MSQPLSKRAVSRRNLLRTGLWTMAGVGAAGGLAGCGGTDRDELSFWNFIGPGSPQHDWMTSLVDTWNARNKVKVRLRFVPFGDYTNGPTLQTAFSAGEGPDVLLLSPGDFLRYRNGDVLVDLTEHLTQSTRDDYLPGTLDSRSFDDRVYGLPMESEPLGLFY
ncbi:MAG: ABC transporter substrate-binding protein, partial [Stackebrandtia sp.]